MDQQSPEQKYESPVAALRSLDQEQPGVYHPLANIYARVSGLSQEQTQIHLEAAAATKLAPYYPKQHKSSQTHWKLIYGGRKVDKGAESLPDRHVNQDIIEEASGTLSRSPFWRR